MDEIIKGIVKQAIYVEGNHLGIQIPKHNNNIEIPSEGVSIKQPIEVDMPSIDGDPVCISSPSSGKGTVTSRT
ncbi:hypothetical protein BAQ49_07690 [Bacillus proteolyticus]|uniref:Uncharacterized protein n=1 Tax=Bacillus proteolyticus TaxID=2026192 RepID=A0AA44KVQ8_9BACI|nr:hypothetical protein [Bacillus proteolyticus]OJE45029.1 hypothetical protein BAQ49_07690 [Bacillus proteolyticus]